MPEEVPSEGHSDVVSRLAERSLSMVRISHTIMRANADLLIGSYNLALAPKDLVTGIHSLKRFI